MHRRLNEQTILFASVLKWFVLATLVGAVVGGASACFIKALDWSIGLADYTAYYFVTLPCLLFLNALFLDHLAPEADAHSTDKVIQYIHGLKSIPAFSIVKSFLGPILTIASGGSAGKEAPAADFGAGLGSLAAKTLRLNAQDMRKLMICGVSAGFAAIFGTPIAGAIFGVEILFVGSLLYDVLFPAFVAGIIGCQVASYFGVTYFRAPLHFQPVFSEGFFIKVSAGGIFFGLFSLIFIESMRIGKKFSAKWKIWEPWKAAIAGLALAGLARIFSPLYLGLGLETIEASLNQSLFVWYAPVLKIVFTALTLCFGGAGGAVTPVFFVGATSGTLFAKLMGLDAATFSAIGIVSVLSGTMNTPIAASIMAIELFGPDIAPYAAISCVISFIITGQRSFYPSQVMNIRKSSSIPRETKPAS